MNLSQWQQRVMRFARGTFTSDELSDITALAQADIMEDLRAWEQFEQVALTVQAGVAALPANHAEIVSVWQGQALLEKTTPSSQHQWDPGYYVTAAGIVPAPTIADGSVLALYHFTRPAALSTEPHALSDKYAGLYLQAGLAYASQLQRDYAGAEEARTAYQGHKESINAAAQEQIAAGGYVTRVG